mmetsp:Transcript_6921/g.22452  ORF Transcript_6921/g.22452 Transcript_6921/m.22452 type:complete len:203 (-) Transcript_6921:129-737(-)
MGNDISKGTKSLFVAAMSNVTSIEKRELVLMRTKFAEAARRDGNLNTITREDFKSALEEIGTNDTDTEVLDRLFTMFDKMGDGQINYREFVVGISPLAQGTVPQKLETAFELYDVDDTGRVKPAEMAFVLNAMNNVASWFGDPGMMPEDVDVVVEDVFKASAEHVSKAGSIPYREHVEAMHSHPIFAQFLAGNGTVHFGGSA